MTYLSIELEFNSPEQLNDLAIPIDTFRSFIKALGRNIVGNFNKYYAPEQGFVHPQIAVRVNVDNEIKAQKVILKIARNLKEQGKIRHYNKELEPWNEPPFVVKAHELGTACAIEFKDQLRKNSKLIETFRTNRVNFLFEFVYVLLKQLQFEPFITWDIKRNFPLPESNLLGIAAPCAQIYRQRSQDFESPDFLERFVHAFLNCVGQEAENIFRNAVLISQVYKLTFDSRRKSKSK
jgi:hypothetical protein